MNQSAIGVLQEPGSLISGGDTDMSTARRYCANDLIRRAWGLEGHRGGPAGEGFLVGKGSLSWTLKSRDLLDDKREFGCLWERKHHGQSCKRTRLVQDVRRRGRRYKKGLHRGAAGLSGGQGGSRA